MRMPQPSRAERERRVGCCGSGVAAEQNLPVSSPGVFHVVDADLTDELAMAFAAVPQVAVDVETSGLDWRQDQLGTCQLFAEGVGPVIVRVADRVPSHVVSLLANPA